MKLIVILFYLKINDEISSDFISNQEKLSLSKHVDQTVSTLKSPV
jgi:hypothetical protein